MMDFVHLHLHSEYSLLDGACRINKLISKVKSCGQKSVAITDHGVMYGVIDFYKAAKKNGIKPIIGCEVYVAPRSRYDREFKIDNKSYHLCLLCKDYMGYKNLIKLVSLAFTDGFYSKPRIDRELIEKYHEGLICLSGCIGGEVAQLLLKNDYIGAKTTALFYQNIFGKDDYYIEIQNHGLDSQKNIRNDLIKLSREIGSKLVATNDAHYIDKRDSKMHKVLLCIQTGTTIDELKIDFGTDEFYVKTNEEMYDLFNDIPEALSNSVEIAEKCNLNFEFGVIKLPEFHIENGDNKEFFINLCYNGLKNRYGSNPSENKIKRLEYEISIIESMGYIDYFLIVYDFVRYAKYNAIPVGPGRGSGAGSIAAYCMGITDIDPIKYNLLFERFLNPERISMPDFDIDFCYEKRQEVIDYVVSKYGKEHVAQIVTFGTMAAKMAIRDVARVLGIPYNVADMVAKAIPTELNITIDKALDVSVDLKNLYDSDEKIKELITMAKNIEGMPRHTSTHAAGIVITKDFVDTYVPLQKVNDSVMTQFTMGTLEELGLLKMDFLGLRTLTVISDAEKMVKKNDKEFNIKNILYDDKRVFDMLSKGLSNCVFQFESAGMKQVLMNLKPENIEDLIAVISLYRPGPMESIPKYIKCKNNPSIVVYKHPLLENILKVTYGCVVYQEQVMQICRELAGYSYGMADLVRRAMSKKKSDIMEKERKNFIYGSKNIDGTIECAGAINNGVSEKVAHEIFDEMNSFASYAFNKSHATAYAILSYQTAYLKCHYPKEFMAAILTSVLDNTDKIVEYIEECHRINVNILPPDINKSYQGFIVDKGEIRFGLVAVKNVGRGFIKEVIKERTQNGDFKSLYDFCKRMYAKDISKKNLESLIKCGAFDNIHSGRKDMLSKYAMIISSIHYQHKIMLEGQLTLFNNNEENNSDIEVVIDDKNDFSANEKLKMEKEVTGLYISGHPLDKYNNIISQPNISKILDINIGAESHNKKYEDKKVVDVIGVITNVEFKVTKSGNNMAFIVIEDKTSSIEILIFYNLLEKVKPLIIHDSIIIVNGVISVKDEREVKILANDLIAVEDYNAKLTAREQNHIKRKGLYLKISSQDSIDMDRSRNILEIFDGPIPVYIYFIDKKKLLVAPRNLWVDISSVMIDELKDILGDENVVYVT